MNKAALLTDLDGRDFVDWVGTPVADAANEADGSIKYTVLTRQAVDIVAGYVNVRFVVVNEGQGNEVAYYLDAEPNRLARQRAFLKFLFNIVLANKESYKGLQLLVFDEVLEFAIYCTLADTNPATQEVWYYRKGGGGVNPRKISSFNPALLGAIATP